jgi:acetylornithine/succinyldiaminopimelate/putrescine aminotransferase
MNAFTNNPYLGHLTTFGGHPVSCAAGLAALRVLTRDTHIIQNVKKKADLFRELLQHKAVLEIRNKGLIMGVQFESYDFVYKVIHKCLKNGLITDWFLFNAESVRIAPPLTISEEEITKACTILLDAVNKTCSNG